MKRQQFLFVHAESDNMNFCNNTLLLKFFRYFTWIPPACFNTVSNKNDDLITFYVLSEITRRKQQRVGYGSPALWFKGHHLSFYVCRIDLIHGNFQHAVAAFFIQVPVDPQGNIK